MIRFFNRHQSTAVTVIALCSALTMTFMGVKGSMWGEKERTEPIAIELHDHTTIPVGLYHAVERILLQDMQTDPGTAPWAYPNLLNPGILSDQIIASGIGEVLVRPADPVVQAEWQEILDRQHAWQPYQHPLNPHISVHTLLQRFGPNLLRPVARLEEDPATFLYQQTELRKRAGVISASTTHQWLRIMEIQSRLPHDHNLDQIDLRLFGHRQLADWYGAEFIARAVRLVLEAAHAAEKMGIHVSNSEIEARWHQEIQRYTSMNVPEEEILARIFKSLQITPAQAREGWRHLLLFERWLEHTRQAVVAQSPDLQVEVSKAIAEAETEAWLEVEQSPLQIQGAEHLWGFESYLEGVGGKRADALALPAASLPLEKILRRAPELVEQPIQVRLRRLDHEAGIAQVTLAETAAWQRSDQGWLLLTRRCQSLAGREAVPVQQRAALLAQLPPAEFKAADRMARQALFLDNGPRVEAALAQAPIEEVLLHASFAELRPLLPDGPSHAQLHRWTAEGHWPQKIRGKRWSYLVEQATAEGGARVATFVEALERGGVHALAQRRLQEEYDLLVVQGSPLVTDGAGEALPFASCAHTLREKKMEQLHQALLAKYGEALPEGQEAWMPYRLAPILEQAVNEEDPILAQFKPEQHQERLQKWESPQHRAWSLALGAWSLPTGRDGRIERWRLARIDPGEERLEPGHGAVAPLLKQALQREAAALIQTVVAD